jgi:hypothetical protein
MNANFIIYCFLSLGFLAFALLAALSWKGRPTGFRLILAGAMSSIWGAMHALSANGFEISAGAIWIVEMLRNVGWLWFLMGASENVLTERMKSLCDVFGISSLLIIPIFWVFPSEQLGSWTPIKFMSVATIAFSVVLLFLLIRIYQKADKDVSRSSRYLLISLGSVFLYDLISFSLELSNSWPQENLLTIRGLIGVISIPFLVLSARYNRSWSIDIFISRHVVFYSTTFLAVGLYFLTMLLGGFYLKSIDSRWGALLESGFFVLCGLLLLWAIFSRGLKKKVRVYISKNFFRYKYEYREEWLRFISRLSAHGSQEVPHAALAAVVEVMKSDKGLLFYLNSNSGSFDFIAALPNIGQGYLYQDAVSATEGWIEFLEKKKWIVDFNEFKDSPDLYAGMVFPAWMIRDAQWRLLSPIMNSNELVGFMLLGEPPPPFFLTYEDRDLLITLGRQVATQLSQYVANKKLTEVQQFEAFNRLTAYMMHDLKNSAAQMSLLVKNSIKYKNNPEFIDDAIATIDGVVKRIDHLIEQLKTGSEVVINQRLVLDRVVRRAVELASAELPQPKLFLADINLLIDADIDKLISVLGHLIKNAQQATTDQGSVEVIQSLLGKSALIEIKDDGCGMDEFFIREKLFRPFFSTKGTRGMGIGAHQARDYIQSIGGNLLVESKLGVGTCIKVTIPCASA